MHDTISVIIPVRSELEDIEILKYLDKVEYPKDKIEIILSIGTWPSVQRNKAANVAKGDILYFFNKDARIEPDIFNKIVKIINGDIRIAGVGGPDLTPKDNSFMQQLFGYAMGSYFAHWKMRARYSRIGKERISDEKELLLSNMAIRTDIYLKADGFNEGMYPNEENELINRISKMGYKFIYNPEIKIYRDRRKTIFAFAKQFYRYGQGRMNQIFIEGALKNLHFFIPIFLTTYFLMLPFMRNFWLAFTPLLLYIFFSIIDAAYISLKNKKNLVFVLPMIYAVMHISYAVGMLGMIFKKTAFRNFGIKRKNNCSIIYVKV